MKQTIEITTEIKNKLDMLMFDFGIDDNYSEAINTLLTIRENIILTSIYKIKIKYKDPKNIKGYEKVSIVTTDEKMDELNNIVSDDKIKKGKEILSNIKNINK